MNQLKTKIEEVKAKLGVSTMQLSERLGKNPYYLYKVMNGVSTERQKELMLELDLVANGGTVMTERTLIAELTEKAAELQETNKQPCHKIKLAENEYKELDAAFHRACEKICELSDILYEHKRRYHNLVAMVVVTAIIVILGFVLWSVV